MSTTPTNNPIPSESPKDLAFNAGKIDEFVNSPEEAFSDRFGLARLTLTGIQAEAGNVIDALGYVPIDSFEAGATITVRNQVLHYLADNTYYRWDGAFPKAVSESSTPTSSGGVGVGKWLSVGDATLRPRLAVTENVVGSNNYSDMPSVGGSITAGNDYLYNDVLYTTVGDSGTITSISDNVVTTSGGTIYLLDKRWPVNDVRAWGVRDGVLADTAFTNCAMYFIRRGGGVRSIYVPPIVLLLNTVTLTDVSTFNIHFDGTYIVTNFISTGTSKSSVIKIYNAHTFSITGTAFIEQPTGNNYLYAIELTAGLPSLIAPTTGLMHNVSIQDFRVAHFPCAFLVGDGTDLQISEINIGLMTNRCNSAIEAKGSQVIVNSTGQAMCEPQAEFTYPKALFNAVGGIIYHTNGEAVASVDNDSYIARVSSIASTTYGNPFGSVKITGCHVECAGLMMLVQQGSGIIGATDSKYSSVTFSNCQGSMLNGNGELISQGVNDYEGRFAVDNTCNFYTSATRNKRIVYSTSNLFKFDVSPTAFGKGFGVLASEIGSQNVNWRHGLQPAILMTPNVVTIPTGTTANLGFSSRASTGDYAFYYGDTSAGGVVTIHSMDSATVSIRVPSSTALLIIMKINGTEYFSCQNYGEITIPRDYLAVGAVIEFTATNTSGSTSTISGLGRILISISNNN